MVLRLLAFLILVTGVGGGVWYFLRETPQTRVIRLREEARSILDDADQLRRAEALTNEILELLPRSVYDLAFKARLNELKGTPEGLRDALDLYDQILAYGDPGYLAVAFLKARVSRRLGLISDADASLRSVADEFPLRAYLELGETALVSLRPFHALRYFEKARELAGTDAERMRAEEGVADAYTQLLAIGAHASARVADPAAVPAGKVEAWQRQCREALERILSFVRRVRLPSSQDEAEERLVTVARVAEKLFRVRSPGSSPYEDAALLVQSKLKSYGPVLARPPTRTWIALGTLRLLLLDAKRDSLVPRAASEVAEVAERDFRLALGRTREDAARELLPPPPDDAVDGAADDGRASYQRLRAYARHLLAVARAYLGTDRHGKILEDSSRLRLAGRIADAAASPDPEISGVFRMVMGLAKLRAGETAAARRDFESYLGSVAVEYRRTRALDLARRVRRHAPDSELVLEYVDRLDDERQPLDFISDRVSLLLSLRNSEELAESVGERLRVLLERAAKGVASPFECLGVARLVDLVEGREAAIAHLRREARKHPEWLGLRRLLIGWLATRAETAGAAGESATSFRRECLAEIAELFFRAPAYMDELPERARSILEALADENEKSQLEVTAMAWCPSFSMAVARELGDGLAEYFRGDAEAALELFGRIRFPGSCARFLSFLKGICHVQLASQESGAGVDSVALSRDHVQRAVEQFEASKEFPASRLELLKLEVRQLPIGEDVSDDLLARLREASTLEDLGHMGHYLLARALRQRFLFRYQDRAVKNSELARWLSSEQRSLRAAIRRNRSFDPAYLALADCFVLPDRVDRQAMTGDAPSRRLFAADYRRAANVLQAAPRPGQRVIERLIGYLEIEGRREAVTPYLEQLALTVPSERNFSRLCVNYVRTASPGLKVILAEDDKTFDQGTHARLPVWLTLRKALETLPTRDALRHVVAAFRLSLAEAGAASTSRKVELRAQSVAAYRRALKEYDAAGVEPPLTLLNNLAWCLCGADDPNERAEGLVVARRGRELAMAHELTPEIQDTYAWALYRNGQLLEAREELRALLAAVDRPTFRYHLAAVHFALRDYDSALAELRHARESTAEFPERDEAVRLEAEVREVRRRIVGE